MLRVLGVGRRFVFCVIPSHMFGPSTLPIGRSVAAVTRQSPLGESAKAASKACQHASDVGAVTTCRQPVLRLERNQPR